MNYLAIEGASVLSLLGSYFSAAMFYMWSFHHDNDINDKIINAYFVGALTTGIVALAAENGYNQVYEKATSYVQTLSTEELEALSKDLVSANISDSDIEDELSDRLNTLSDNEELFGSDEKSEILQKSLVDYLVELSDTDYEEYRMVLETLSDGVYEDGELTDELVKDEVVKKLNL